MADHIRIIAKVDGFRRAGIAHSTEARFYPKAQFTAMQLDQLRTEPMLVVDEMDPPAAENAESGSKTAAGRAGRSGGRE
jgi:DUF917 family protein